MHIISQSVAVIILSIQFLFFVLPKHGLVILMHQIDARPNECYRYGFGFSALKQTISLVHSNTINLILGRREIVPI